MAIYRVLDLVEKKRLDVENKIYSNSDYDEIAYVINNGSPIFGDNLDEIISHVQNGNTTTSRWISCSKDLTVDLEKYTVSNLYFKKNQRTDVAVINNHDESSLKIKGIELDIFKEIRSLRNYDLENKQVRQLINFIRNKKIMK